MRLGGVSPRSFSRMESGKKVYNFELSFVETHTTEELREELIQKGYIKKDFKEHFQFEDLNKKDSKVKQRGLDYFLNR